MLLIGRAIGAAAPFPPEPGAARHSQPLLAAGQRWWHAPQRRAPQAGGWRRKAPRRCAGWCSGQPSSCCWRRPWSATSRHGGSSGGDSAPSSSMWQCAGSGTIRTGDGISRHARTREPETDDDTIQPRHVTKTRRRRLRSTRAHSAPVRKRLRHSDSLCEETPRSRKTASKFSTAEKPLDDGGLTPRARGFVVFFFSRLLRPAYRARK